MRTFPLFFFVVAAALPGCFVPPGCNPEATSCVEPAATGCDGQCMPYVGRLWSPVVIGQGEVTNCPPQAPFAALASDNPPLVACAVLGDEDACATPGFVCLPDILPPWTVCVVRDGPHACPEPYPEGITAGGVTVCCPGEPEPPG